MTHLTNIVTKSVTIYFSDRPVKKIKNPNGFMENNSNKHFGFAFSEYWLDTEMVYQDDTPSLRFRVCRAMNDLSLQHAPLMAKATSPLRDAKAPPDVENRRRRTNLYY
ncbi:hypothetical protein BLOT_012037 [Blomia tropicalis]|nr:hypothetical protein BLOT_012037 [Blomia tropicalis]